MAEFDARALLTTDDATVWDVVCPGRHAHPSEEECTSSTYFVFPYRGVYIHHVGRGTTIAEANQVVVLNEDEPYRVSHPVAGGDAGLSISVAPGTLAELAPAHYRHPSGKAALNLSHLRVDVGAQSSATQLRQRLRRGTVDTLEAEILTIELIRRALGRRTAHRATGSASRRRLVDRAKLVIASEPGRRWTLDQIAGEVSASPVYLTQVFRQVEGVPLYKYQLQLRLARALNLLQDSDDLARLAVELGFSSHSHFSSAFKKAYGHTPAALRRSARQGTPLTLADRSDH
ncbi:MAG TPA: AraC family transcriptional regulator [Pseudonocardia sp.]|jgi:AraC-like DNA-binding protein